MTGSGVIDMQPLTGEAPRRLIVLLHAAGSSPGAIVHAALAWQLKLRIAQAMLLDAPFATSRARRYWVDPMQYPVESDAIRAAADGARGRIEARQARLDLDAGRTMVIGFSQGASVALELAFGEPGCAGLVIAYAARLYRLPTTDDRVAARVRLVHGGSDSVVPAAYGEAAYRRLRGIGANVTLDLLPEEGHAVGQVQINRGTRHAMDWVFDRSPDAQGDAQGDPH